LPPSAEPELIVVPAPEEGSAEASPPPVERPAADERPADERPAAERRRAAPPPAERAATERASNRRAEPVPRTQPPPAAPPPAAATSPERAAGTAKPSSPPSRLDDEMVVAGDDRAVFGAVPPRKVFAPQPAYPESARQAGEQGTVVISGRISARGDVLGAQVLRGASANLDRAALEAFRTWQFQPAVQDGKAIDSDYQVAFHFALEDAAVAAAAAPTGDDEAPLPSGGDFEPPRRRYSPLPVYPPGAWASGASGDVVLLVVVDRRGSVGRVEVVQGLPHGITEAAVEAVKRWKFFPATRNGEAVAVQHRVRLRFTP
jgi:protein TonB